MTRTFVTRFECGLTGESEPPRPLATVSRAGKPLFVRYDLAAVARAVSRHALAGRSPGLWRWRELLPLPLDVEPLSLGEDETPLVPLPALAREQGVRELLVKDEGRLPTGSFKARGLCMAVNLARLDGVRAMAIPTNGNAGAAMAAYCARAGIEAHAFCPVDTPRANLDEIALLGARLEVVDGRIDDCGKLVAAGEREGRWFNCATLREPYRIEGKKTMGLELAAQLGWELPDAIFYPTGGGTGLIGMWKAFAEMAALGWIGGPGKRLPRMYAIQSEGCAPIVRAFESGAEHAARWENAKTVAHGINVPQALGDFLILRAVRESGGAALAVSEESIAAAWRDAAERDGQLLCPEGAATLAGLRLARARGLVGADEHVVLFNCAAASKYPLPTGGGRSSVATGKSAEARNAELLALHEATLDISGELDVDVVLQRVVDRARQLSDARYGALAIYDSNGTIDRFLVSGISAEEQRSIGPPPVGRGLLGSVLRGGETLRLRDLASHPRSAGFPPGHPPMRSLLAVPIVSRGPWRGNLYVSDKQGAPEFDPEDERTLQRFAAQAALAIEAAHLHRQVRGLAIAEERQRIAHEMHDGLAQVLASVITGTQAIREYLRAGRQEEALALLDELRRAADTTYTETREGILALRAAGSAGGDPIDRLLLDYVTDWSDRTGIGVRASFGGDLAVPSATELQLVRIAQEALANVRKHSGARQVEVVFEAVGDELLLAVRDDGRGFEETGGARTGAPRFGLATMRERAQSIGGRLEISSRAGGGTSVELRLPKPPGAARMESPG